MKLIKLSITATLLAFSFNANSALFERLGGLAYYDDIAGLTWLADTNASGTISNWSDAVSWATSLNVDGVTGWRLPETTVSPGYASGFDYDCIDSEMCNLFYNVLGGTQNVSIGTTHNSNYDLFLNQNNGGYWSATEYTLYSPDDKAWMFQFFNGGQNITDKIGGNLRAWAVYSGDVDNFVSAVPVPAAAWLFASGLIGLVGFSRRKG